MVRLCHVACFMTLWISVSKRNHITGNTNDTFFIRVPLFALRSEVQPVSNGRGTVLKSHTNALTEFLVLDHSVTCCRFTAASCGQLVLLR